MTMVMETENVSEAVVFSSNMMHLITEILVSCVIRDALRGIIVVKLYMPHSICCSVITLITETLM
jgi:hypothetical protein